MKPPAAGLAGKDAVSMQTDRVKPPSAGLAGKDAVSMQADRVKPPAAGLAVIAGSIRQSASENLPGVFENPLLTDRILCAMLYQRLQKVFFFCAKSRGSGAAAVRFPCGGWREIKKSTHKRIYLEVRHAYKDYIVMH